jgi:hypothetical protein
MLRSIVVGVALVLVLPVGGASAASCPKGKLAWKVEGRQRCVKTAKVPGVAQPPSATVVERLLVAASRPAPLGRRSALSAGVRRRLARAAGPIGKRAGTLEQQAAKATVGAAGLRAFFVQAWTITSPTFTEGGVTGRISATVDDNGQATIGIEAAVKIGQDTTAIDLDMTPPLNTPTERCPDADGRVRTSQSTGARMTTKVLRGRKVLSASTVRTATTAATVGQVGDDGFLQGATSTVTTTTGAFARGYSVETTSTITVSGQKTGGFTPTGSPKTDARLRANGASAAEERAGERSIADDAATSGDVAKAAGREAARARDRVKEQEKGWTDLERNPCIDVAWTPTVPGALEPGQSIGVTGRIIRKDGKPAASRGTWTVTAQGPGTFTGPGPSFTATGGQPGGTGDTVLGVVVVASRSGRVQAPWYATGGDLPANFTATMSQHEDMAPFGVTLDFDLTARWERTSVQANPDGTRQVLYAVTAATSPRWVYDQSAGGCVYHGEGSGGSPVSGDVELQLAADGSVRYGFVVDVDLGSPTIPLTGGPPGCPGSASPHIKAIVQARRKPDSALYAAPPGALQKTNFDVTVTGTQDSVGDSDGIRDLTTSWTLTGR